MRLGHKNPIANHDGRHKLNSKKVIKLRPHLKEAPDSGVLIKEEFLRKRQELLSRHQNVQLTQEFAINRELKDEVDQAVHHGEHELNMQLKNRERLYLKKLDQALERIENGTYGICVACGDDIEPARLAARATATKCISCKEEAEKFENSTTDGRKSKSRLGTIVPFTRH